ncbi:hypothetical protein A6X21_20410 [Planctopirus hydrillae]|uniref:Uncharacterized protein n=1 Tax=Planctopirus hydrillae TaxID=1841610 RepID=A0A1C3EHJ0_9PLAN|nr:hypothetical protein A6X21_20410 [Planctopirus hydrillae]
MPIKFPRSKLRAFEPVLSLSWDRPAAQGFFAIHLQVAWVAISGNWGTTKLATTPVLLLQEELGILSPLLSLAGQKLSAVVRHPGLSMRNSQNRWPPA